MYLRQNQNQDEYIKKINKEYAELHNAFILAIKRLRDANIKYSDITKNIPL